MVALSNERIIVDGVIQSVSRARSETEAAWMLADAVPGTKVVAGGTDLMLHIDRKRVQPSSLVDIRRSGMNALLERDDSLEIGATATAADLSKWKTLQKFGAGLWEAAATLSVPQIRNLATLGGNVANASPAADMVPPLLAMDALCEIRKGDDTRRVMADAFALGPGRTVMEHGELLAKLIVPKWSAGAFHHYVKLGFRDAQIIAITSLALSCEIEGGVIRRVGIALGSVAPRVTRAQHVENFLVGQTLTKDVAHEAMQLLAKDISPISDQRSTGPFRLRVAQNYLGDALTRAYLHAQGKSLPKDPAPRPPSMQEYRTHVLQGLSIKTDVKPKAEATTTLSFGAKKKAKKKAAKKKAKKKR